MKLTPWFDGNIKPIRVGVYMQMCGFGDKVGYQYWDGSYWGKWAFTVEDAYDHRRIPISKCFQNDKWRGLTKEQP